MKLYFSIWGYRDPNRVGYDSVGASYHLENPHVFAGVGESAVYEVDIPDSFTKEEAAELGKKAVALMEKTDNYSPGYAVRRILNGDV